jgi:hypothetical protein
MALENKISLTDGMSPVLSKMLDSMNMIIGGMYDLQKASGGVDTARDFSFISNSIAEAGAELDKYRESLTSLGKAAPAAAPAAASPPVSPAPPITNIVPPETVAGIARANEQIAAMTKSVAELDARANLWKTGAQGVGEMNREFEAMKTRIGEVTAAQNDMNAALESGDVGKINEQYNKLKALVDKLEPEIRQNTDEQRKFNDSVNQGTNNSQNLLEKISGMGRAFMGLQAVRIAVRGIRSAYGFVTDAARDFSEQLSAQQRLAKVMQNTMGAGFGDFKEILGLAKSQQSTGVISAGIQIAGSQELGTYLTQSESLKKLIPVMDDMLAQQYGLNATQENAVVIATMLGKVMDGQTGALSRYGYSFDEAQEKILKYGTESERVAVLADVVSSSVGGMNEALAATPTGAFKQIQMDMDGMKNTIGGALQPALLSFYQTLRGVMANIASSGALDAFVNGIIFIMDLLGMLAQGVGAVIDFFVAGAKFVA